MYVRAVKSRGRTFHYWARKERDPATGKWVERKIRRLTDDEVRQLKAKTTSMTTAGMATTPRALGTAQPPNNPEEAASMVTATPPEATRQAAAPTTPPPSWQSHGKPRTEPAGEKRRLPEVFGYKVEYHGEVSVGRFYKLIPTVVGLKVGNVLIANDGEIMCACLRGECEHTQAVRRALS